MPTVMVIGDAATTTSVALAATRHSRVELVEADERGGSLPAWWGIDPTARTAHVLGRVIDVRLLPHHPAEAAHLLGLAEPVSSADELRVVDGGLPVHHPERQAWVAVTDVAVIVIRQGWGTPRMVARRVERGAHLASRLVTAVPSVAVAVIGGAPFRPSDIGTHVLAGVGADATVIALPEDPQAATMIADPAAVGERRWRRTALARALESWEVPL